jgi:hypothetical protein
MNEKRVEIADRGKINEPFVPTTNSYIEHWLGLLEREQSGCLAVYVVMQYFVIRNKSNEHYKKSIFSSLKLSELCGMSRNKVLRALTVLEKYELIKNLSKIGSKSVYKIFDSKEFTGVPSIKDDKIFTVPYTENFEENNTTEEVIEHNYDEDVSMKTDTEIEKEVEIVDDITSNHLIDYFKELYKTNFDLPYREKDPKKDRTSFKILKEDFGAKKSLKIIEYSIKNWLDFEFVDGYPTIGGICGFSKRIAPDALSIGTNTKQVKDVERGEYVSTGKTKTKGIHEW